MKNFYKQKGLNKKYPKEIEVWKINDEYIPEWISDRAKVESVGENGVLKIGTLETNDGGIEIINSNGTGVLVKIENKEEDFICFSRYEEKNVLIKGVFPLTKHQLELLYEKIPDTKV